MQYKNPKTLDFIVIALLIAIIRPDSFKVTLSSPPSQSYKEIPPLPTFSCQLSVFAIYNSTYQAHIEILEPNQLYFKAYFQNTNKCFFYHLSTEQNSVHIIVQDTNFGEYTEITQTIYLEISNHSQKSEDCSDMKNSGQKRRIYLVDKDNKNEFSYGILLPQSSLIITQILAYIVMLLLCHNIKYRKFIPKKFGFLMAALYSVFLFAIVYISTFVEEDFNIMYYITMAVSLVAITIYLIDIASCFLQRNVAIYSLSVVISGGIIILDMLVFPNAWFLNDLIAIMFAGTFIKFIVIKKIKSALLPLTFLWIFFIVRQFAIEFHIQNFEKALEVKISPLHFQIPALFEDKESGYQCSAFGTSKIIVMGLIVNYAVRIDLFLSTKFYTILISVVAFVCLGIEVIISIFSQDLPFMEFMSVLVFMPISILLMLALSSKRGQWAEIWHGSFHDIAIDRKSVKRQSSQLTADSMNRNLDLLKMNTSLLSD